MFGKGLQSKVMGNSPLAAQQQQAPEQPQDDDQSALDAISQKLDMVIQLLQQDKQEDSSEDQRGGDLNA